MGQALARDVACQVQDLKMWFRRPASVIAPVAQCNALANGIVGGSGVTAMEQGGFGQSCYFTLIKSLSCKNLTP